MELIMIDPEKVETEAAPVVDDGMVDIHEATIEDLDAALENAQAEEQNVSVADGNTTPEAPAPQTPEQPQTPGQTDVAAQGAEPSKPARTYTQEEIQGILADNARQRQEVDKKELFIQHRGNELGQLRAQLTQSRQQLAAVKAQLTNGLEDRFAENPVQASNDRDRIKEIDQELQGIDLKEDRAQRIVEAQTFFVRHVDTEKVGIDDIAEVLKSDGVDDRFVAQFKANPWEFTTSEALVQMGKRAMDRKNYLGADSDRRLLAKHVIYLNGELDKLKGRPAQVMKQVQQNLNRPPGVTAASAVSPKGGREISLAAVPQMSDAELNSALEHATRH